jgi:hypothetical protein
MDRAAHLTGAINDRLPIHPAWRRDSLLEFLFWDGGQLLPGGGLLFGDAKVR